MPTLIIILSIQHLMSFLLMLWIPVFQTTLPSSFALLQIKKALNLKECLFRIYKHIETCSWAVINCPILNIHVIFTKFVETISQSIVKNLPLKTIIEGRNNILVNWFNDEPKTLRDLLRTVTPWINFIQILRLNDSSINLRWKTEITFAWQRKRWTTSSLSIPLTLILSCGR